MAELFIPPALADSIANWDGPEGEVWLREFPDRLARLAERWDVELGPPYVPGGVTSYVAPVRRRTGGEMLVCKIVVPHREARDEPDALRAWGGNGAVQLVDAAPDEHALLLEHCDPGTPLGDLADHDAILDIGAGILTRLWSAPAPAERFEALAAVTNWFADLVTERQEVCGHPLPQSLVDEAVIALRELPLDAPRAVVLHHDFHPGNVLASARGWLAIDPKPQVGDPAFDPVQLILQTSDPLDDPDPDAVIRNRLARLCEHLDLERERVRSWGVGRCVEWSLYEHWAGYPDGAIRNAEYARIFSSIG
jgi:streptomycin 6-kinase